MQASMQVFSGGEAPATFRLHSPRIHVITTANYKKVGRLPAFFITGNMDALTLHDKIDAIIAPSLGDMGYALVQIKLSEGSRRTLQIMAERKDGANMTVEDCAAISHQVSALLDVEDPIKGAYTLEVSSPGIDRPLIRREDFERFAGFEAKLESKLPIDGRKRFKGRIAAVEGDDIVFETAEKQVVRIPLRQVYASKLLLTDELIDWHGAHAAPTH